MAALNAVRREHSMGYAVVSHIGKQGEQEAIENISFHEPSRLVYSPARQAKNLCARYPLIVGGQDPRD